MKDPKDFSKVELEFCIYLSKNDCSGMLPSQCPLAIFRMDHKNVKEHIGTVELLCALSGKTCYSYSKPRYRGLHPITQYAKEALQKLTPEEVMEKLL